MSEALPAPDPTRLAATPPRARDRLALPAGTRVVRVHALAGPHPAQWDEFRTWGPTTSRFDHHPDPAGPHHNYGIMYLAHTATAFTTALAEFHQEAGSLTPIEIHDGRDPRITVFTLDAPVHLLDLSSGWITRAGGNQAITSGRRDRARRWARAIYDAYPDVDGVAYRSSVFGPGRCIALWERGQSAVPADPLVSRSYPDLRIPIANAARHHLNTPVLN